jgi:hypothetical protein
MVVGMSAAPLIVGSSTQPTPNGRDPPIGAFLDPILITCRRPVANGQLSFLGDQGVADHHFWHSLCEFEDVVPHPTCRLLGRCKRLVSAVLEDTGFRVVQWIDSTEAALADADAERARVASNPVGPPVLASMSWSDRPSERKCGMDKKQ